MARQNTYPSFTLTFARHISPHRLLQLYGASPEDIRELTEKQSASKRLHDSNLSILRGGRTLDWGFCFENLGTIGFTPNILRRISEGTESVTLFLGGDGMVTLSRCLNGDICEAFEATKYDQPYGEGPFILKAALDEFLVRSAQETKYRAALNFLTRRYGFNINEVMARSTLPTAYVPQVPPAERGDFSSPVKERSTGSGLGPRLQIKPLRE